jgi:hypothetical protein
MYLNDGDHQANSTVHEGGQMPRKPPQNIVNQLFDLNRYK